MGKKKAASITSKSLSASQLPTLVGGIPITHGNQLGLFVDRELEIDGARDFADRAITIEQRVCTRK